MSISDELKRRDIELLAPASNWAMLMAALNNGANSIYFGLKELNMRITAQNFNLKDIGKIVKNCHEIGAKAYLTLNTIIYDDEILRLKTVLKSAKKSGIDAVIVSDMAAISLSKEAGIPIHISTQASISNSNAAAEYAELGASTINLARELSLEQIKKINANLKPGFPRVEVFCHGAMCVSISGRCFLSQFAYNKSANRGDCIQPCRREYKITDPETGQKFDLANNYIMSPKDLCTIEFIDKILETGVDALKIEGRAKQPEYVAVVTRAYRQAIDLWKQGKLTKKSKESLKEEMLEVYNREFHSGFYFSKPLKEFTDDYGSKSRTYKLFIGKVINYYARSQAAEIKLNTGTLSIDDKIYIMGPTTGVIKLAIKSIQIDNKNVIISNKGEIVGITVPQKVRKNDDVYIIKQR
ncbi:U32 family peptidase [Candidatus Woesearchaeota archaeon]|nr:U32 family peptidase [Candidatus Woesearchaeota archaeon]